jgi:hypothetical protein
VKLIYDWRSVDQSVLVSGSHLKPMIRFLFSIRQLRISWCGTPSLTRGWVCNLLVQLLLGLARAFILWSKSRRTHDPILLFRMRLPQPGGPGSRIYIPEEQGGPVIPPGTGFPFHRLLRLAGLRWRYSNLPPHRAGRTNRLVNCLIHLILPVALGPRVYSASNRNECQKHKNKFLGSRARPASKANNLTAICESIIWTIRDSQHLTTAQASMVCYGDSFYFKESTLKIKKGLTQSSTFTVAPPPQLESCSPN